MYSSNGSSVETEEADLPYLHRTATTAASHEPDKSAVGQSERTQV